MDLSSSTENLVTPASNLTAEIARLTRAAEEEVERIHKAALSHREKLLREVEWYKEEEQANATVVNIRLAREVERLVQESLGETLTDGPIHKLPPELLSCVFRCYAALDMSPWGLVKVCKSWMRTAVETPRLWRHICVTQKWDHSQWDTWVVDGKKRNSLGRFQICVTVVQLQAALRRAGAVPLEIEVEFNYNWGGSIVDSFLPLFRAILSNPISERLEILRMKNLTIGSLPKLSIGRFPLLREVDLPRQLDSWTYSLLESACVTATQFDTLRLHSEISAKLVGYSFWPLLKVLGLSAAQSRQRRFNDIAESLINLEELQTCPRPWPNQDTPRLTWGKIRLTSIYCARSHLGRARFPNLTSLVFVDEQRFHEEAEEISPPILFPKLEELRVTTPDPRWLAKASLPSLTVLTVYCELREQVVMPEGASLLFNATTFPALGALTLGTPWLDSTLSDVLTSLPNLSTVAFASNQSNDQSFGLLLLKLLEAQQPFLCPHLVSMSLGTATLPVFTLKKNAVPLLKRLVTSRKKIGKPLEILSVYWTRGLHTVENYAYLNTDLC